MPYCRCCGSLTDHSGGLCVSCEASSGRGIGTPEDVPCQRCGMYLPPHELRMWNSRLYCAYCIMDIQDEEERIRKHAKGEHAGEAASGHGSEGGAAQRGEAGDSLRQGNGVCEKCGRSSDTLYSLGGRRLCPSCHSEEGGIPPASPSLFGQIVLRVKKVLQRKQPEIVAAPPTSQVFDVKKRKMVEKEEKSEKKKG